MAVLSTSGTPRHSGSGAVDLSIHDSGSPSGSICSMLKISLRKFVISTGRLGKDSSQRIVSLDEFTTRCAKRGGRPHVSCGVFHSASMRRIFRRFRRDKHISAEDNDALIADLEEVQSLLDPLQAAVSRNPGNHVVSAENRHERLAGRCRCDACVPDPLRPALGRLRASNQGCGNIAALRTRG
jgi:hypothetical protein